SRLYAGFYIAELLQELTDLGDPHPELYRRADQTLLALDRDGPVAETVLGFEVAALRLLGYLPALEDCVVCGTPIGGGSRVLFGQLAGGVLCPRCRQGQKQVVSVSPRGLEVLQQLANPSAVGTSGEIDPRVRGELRGLLSHYLTNLLGHPPRVLPFLGFLVNP
ncbi:MAG: DNA repair protein RecO, partial [Pirellulaceae bacterium]|nr:DNA repair protein RecO [Pirellulaceae bacterium]